MKDTLKKATLCIRFLAVLLLLLLLLSFFFAPKTNTQEGGILDPKANGIFGEAPNTVDVLIVGDSEAYCALIPLQLWEQHGITSYCCATSAQTLSYSEQFVHKVFHNQSPQVVVLETNAVGRL